MKTTEIEVMRVPVISTAHLSEAEGQRSAAEWPITPYECCYGFIVPLSDIKSAIELSRSELEDDSVDPLTLWPGLLAAAAWATKNGFTWIRFDCDADRIPDLPTWEW